MLSVAGRSVACGGSLALRLLAPSLGCTRYVSYGSHSSRGGHGSHISHGRGKIRDDVRRGRVALPGGCTPGRRLHYETREMEGVANDWGLLWGHGLTSSIQSEDEGGWPFASVRELSDLLPVTRYDARGHGQSDCARSGCAWAQIGEDVSKLKKTWGKRRTVLGGTSMGTAASLFAALHDGANVAGLVLATPPTCYEARQKFVPLYRESAALARSSGLDAAREVASSKARPPIFDETEESRAMFDIGWKTKLEMGPERYARALEGAAASDLPPAAALKELQDLPVLILAWRSDVQHPLATARLLHQLLPRSELIVASRWAEVQQFHAHMRDFLQRLQRAESEGGAR
eukprot:TRINITY_DN54516_c0_g1_i1.p1 TRINITY_DN54516_c0_g1~~TRINITY_DN54516_c0_g1_i1.p1  ORF type:complete len:346 (+),score=76.08 TRINITY_DN54516_c0_g1_i1:76-1113(+)